MRERRFLLLRVPCYSPQPTNANPENDHLARYMLFTPLTASSLNPVCILLLAAWLLCGPMKAAVAGTANQRWSTKETLYLQDGTGKPEPVEIRELKLGQSVEREITGSQAHLYHLTLVAGQYLNITVEQRDVNVEIQLLNPTGKSIAAIDWGGTGTTESLWALGEATGDYQAKIKITANDPKAPGQRYIVKLEKIGELKTAPSSDQEHVKAHRLFWEASELRDQVGDQARRQAAEKYKEALPLWRALKDSVGEATTLHDLGYVYSELGELEKALETYAQALSIWRAAKSHQPEEADTLYNMGSVYSASGRAAEATKCFRAAIELRRLSGDKISLAYALTNLGQVYINIGEFRTALESHQEALLLRRATGDVQGEAKSLSNIAGVYFRLGEFQEALNYCQQALPLRRAAKDRRGEVITLTNLGSVYRELGEPQKALEYDQQALSLMRALPDDHYTEAAILDAIGLSYYDLGDYAKALEFHMHSLSLRPMMKDSYGEASALANVGNVYARMGEREKALAYFEKSLQLRRAIGDRRGEALTLQNAGELYLESGELQKAVSYFNEGLDLSRAIKNKFFEANLLYDIARVEQRAGHIAAARPRIEAAIGIIESTRTTVTSADLRASFFASKQDFYELEIDLLMQSHGCYQSQEGLTKAFGVSEQRRARSLLDSLEEARANIRQGVSPELLTRERESRAKLNQKAESQIKLLSGKHTAEQAAASAREVDAITTDYEQVLTEIRASSPRYASLTQPAPLSLRDIQTDVLDPDTLLLEYALGKERSYLWAVTSATIAGFELPPRTEIESLARRAYDLMTSRNRFVKFEESQERQARIAKADVEYEQAASELSQMLLGPVAALMGNRRLLIVSDGTLQYLSFAALPLPASSAQRGKPTAYVPLIAEHEVISLPSVSTLAVLRKEIAGRKPAPKTIAVLADPVFDNNDERVKTNGSEFKPDGQRQRKDETQPDDEIPISELTRSAGDLGLADKRLRFPRLPFTRREADAITGLAAPEQNRTATDFAANRATAMAPEMSQYRYVHFATHGLLNNTHPELSGIVLSLVDENGRENNGFLTTNEIYNLNLPAEMIVLSGCRTGLGKELKGEGILGLTRAFMYAGAPRVLVSLWDVNDESTAELMTGLYKGILGKKRLSPAAALREAQISMLRSARWHMPYFWSAFVLQGEYR